MEEAEATGEAVVALEEDMEDTEGVAGTGNFNVSLNIYIAVFLSKLNMNISESI